MGDVAGLEIVRPMAVVLLGGLVTSALTNLFVVPAVYARFARSQPEMQTYGEGEQHAAS
jgi:Cu/Ag efflux pump CusA